LGLAIFERADILRFPGLRARNFSRISDNILDLLLKQPPQGFPRIGVFHKALDAFITGVAAAAHFDCDLRQA
jgi:hypothetical protein